MVKLHEAEEDSEGGQTFNIGYFTAWDSLPHTGANIIIAGTPSSLNSLNKVLFPISTGNSQCEPSFPSSPYCALIRRIVQCERDRDSPSNHAAQTCRFLPAINTVKPGIKRPDPRNSAYSRITGHLPLQTLLHALRIRARGDATLPGAGIAIPRWRGTE